MEAADHQMNYRMSILPVGGLLALAALAAAILFIVYAVEWNDHRSDTPDDGTSRDGETHRQYVDRIRTEYSYYATVISLLCILVFFNGYHLTRM